MMAAGADADEAGGSATPTRTLRRRSQRRSSSTPPANVSTSKAKNAHGLFFCYENGLQVCTYVSHYTQMLLVIRTTFAAGCKQEATSSRRWRRYAG